MVRHNLVDPAWDDSYILVRKNVTNNILKETMSFNQVNSVLFDPRHLTIWTLNETSTFHT
jgi:hypothetical protein